MWKIEIFCLGLATAESIGVGKCKMECCGGPGAEEYERSTIPKLWEICDFMQESEIAFAQRGKYNLPWGKPR